MKLKSFAVFIAAVLATAAAAGQDKNAAESYIWYDGGKPKRVWVDKSVVAEFGSRADSGSAPVAKAGLVNIRSQDDPAVSRAATQGRVSPVLRDGLAGRMRALPGNVIVRLDPAWSSGQVDAWLAAQGLTRIRQLPIGKNLLVVGAPPGLASLELANRLQESGTVVSAQPEWWEQMERR